MTWIDGATSNRSGGTGELSRGELDALQGCTIDFRRDQENRPLYRSSPLDLRSVVSSVKRGCGVIGFCQQISINISRDEPMNTDTPPSSGRRLDLLHRSRWPSNIYSSRSRGEIRELGCTFHLRLGPRSNPCKNSPGIPDLHHSASQTRFFRKHVSTWIHA